MRARGGLGLSEAGSVCFLHSSSIVVRYLHLILCFILVPQLESQPLESVISLACRSRWLLCFPGSRENLEDRLTEDSGGF